MMDNKVEPQTRKEILKLSLDARIQEVMHYQINIDNYRIALEEISKMSDDERVMLADFSDQLRTLMASEKLEQKKAQVMLTVLQKQVG
jgi:transcriptional regulator of acetoin/glycerol metabolism